MKKPLKKTTFTYEEPAKKGGSAEKETGKKAKPVQTKAQKTAANKSWKRATAASKKEGVNLSDLIKFRDESKRQGKTKDVAKAQNKINEYYGVEKRHEEEPVKKQFGGRIPAQQARTGMRPPIAGPARGYDKGGEVTSEGYPVHRGPGNYKVGE